MCFFFFLSLHLVFLCVRWGCCWAMCFSAFSYHLHIPRIDRNQWEAIISHPSEIIVCWIRRKKRKRSAHVCTIHTHSHKLGGWISRGITKHFNRKMIGWQHWKRYVEIISFHYFAFITTLFFCVQWLVFDKVSWKIARKWLLNSSIKTTKNKLNFWRKDSHQHKFIRHLHLQ